MTVVIETQALQKKYGNHQAVNGIDVRVERGSVFGLIGPNGAGKTTVLRMLLDIIRPSSGELKVLGETPRRSGAALRKRIGYLPGEFKLVTRTTGGALLRHLAQISGPVETRNISRLADRLGLDLTQPVRSLSKGNKQKLGLVQAFMHQPELLILDEPTSGLDPLMQREFLSMVREARDNGQTVLLSSHVLSEIQHTADEVAVLAQGEILAHGDVASLRLSSVSRLQASIIGDSAEIVLTRLSQVKSLEGLDVESAVSGGLIRVSARVRGDMDPVVRVLAQFTVQDLTIEEPDLEESIIDLYARTDQQS